MLFGARLNVGEQLPEHWNFPAASASRGPVLQASSVRGDFQSERHTLIGLHLGLSPLGVGKWGFESGLMAKHRVSWSGVGWIHKRIQSLHARVMMGCEIESI